jgi:hypothetical protein
MDESQVPTHLPPPVPPPQLQSDHHRHTNEIGEPEFVSDIPPPSLPPPPPPALPPTTSFLDTTPLQSTSSIGDIKVGSFPLFLNDYSSPYYIHMIIFYLIVLYFYFTVSYRIRMFLWTKY